MHASAVSHEEIAMADSRPRKSSFPQDRYKNPETRSAAPTPSKDDVRHRKRTDSARRSSRRDVPTASAVKSGAGQGATWTIIGFLAIAAVLVYLLVFQAPSSSDPRQGNSVLRLIFPLLVGVGDFGLLDAPRRRAPARSPRSRRSSPRAASYSRSPASRNPPTPARRGSRS